MVRHVLRLLVASLGLVALIGCGGPAFTPEDTASTPAPETAALFAGRDLPGEIRRAFESGFLDYRRSGDAAVLAALTGNDTTLARSVFGSLVDRLATLSSWRLDFPRITRDPKAADRLDVIYRLSGSLAAPERGEREYLEVSHRVYGLGERDGLPALRSDRTRELPSIRGRVVAHDGVPVPFARVSAGPFRVATTDGTGRFELTGLPPEPLELLVEAERVRLIVPDVSPTPGGEAAGAGGRDLVLPDPREPDLGPAPIRDLEAEPRGAEIRLSFRTGEGRRPTGFRVRRRAENEETRGVGSFRTLAALPPEAMSYVDHDPKLSPGVLYTYRVDPFLETLENRLSAAVDVVCATRRLRLDLPGLLAAEAAVRVKGGTLRLVDGGVSGEPKRVRFQAREDGSLSVPLPERLTSGRYRVRLGAVRHPRSGSLRVHLCQFGEEEPGHALGPAVNLNARESEPPETRRLESELGSLRIAPRDWLERHLEAGQYLAFVIPVLTGSPLSWPLEFDLAWIDFYLLPEPKVESPE